MTDAPSQTDAALPNVLPHYRTLLDETDWASLATPCGTGEILPAALARLLDPDPGTRAAAVFDALGAVTHQNSIYEATVPVALYVAAILNHPATAMGNRGRDADRAPHRPTRAALLDWLSSTAYDADDENVAAGERHCGKEFLDDYQEMRAFRDLRPVFYSAVQPLLGNDDAEVRAAAVVAAIPLVEHPALVPHRGELADRARDLLSTSADRYKRDRVFDALKAWGHDTSGLENADDLSARELRARRIAERASWAGGYAEEPPF
ncbi:hypothetical protein ABT093_02805 [Kitasatospora sp. NPDC002551]|uniref:hypothetical protein n=1 Tax=Kitasatospora sp. NPDC002551 TaxID=3154539 RepID=UPI003330B2C9